MFSQCTNSWLRAATSQYLQYVIPVPWQVPPMPAVLLPPPLLSPYRGGPLLPFWQHGRLCPAVILNTKFLRHMFALKW